MQTFIETFMQEQNKLDMELERQLRRIQAIKIPPSKPVRHAWPSPEEGFPMSRTTTFTEVKEEPFTEPSSEPDREKEPFSEEEPPDLDDADL